MNAKAEFIELNAGPLIWNTRFYILLVLFAVANIGLVAGGFFLVAKYAGQKPIIVGMDELGRPRMFTNKELEYQPSQEVFRHFLIQFTRKHYSMVRAQLSVDYPESLQFLDEKLRRDTIRRVTDDQSIEKFLKGRDRETTIVVKNVTLGQIASDPVTARIDFEKHYQGLGTDPRTKGEPYTAIVEMKRLDPPPFDMIPVNPLGIQITSLDVQQQAFQ